MNDVETRLRDALAARATGLSHDPTAYHAVLRRRARRRVTRRLRPVGAVVATAAVVAVAVAVTRPPAERPPVAGAAPAYAVALRARLAPEPALWTDRVMVLSTTALGDDPVYELPASYGGGLDVAGTGDGTTFFAATAAPDCRSNLLRLGPTGEPLLLGTVAGVVRGLAATADGARLAYGVGGCADDGEGRRGELRVYDVAARAEQVWRAADDMAVTSTTWAPDGRRVAFDADLVRIVVVDTALPGRTLPDFERRIGSCVQEAPAFLPGGELTVFRTCPSGDPAVVVWDADAGQPGRTVFAVPEDVRAGAVAFDRTGRHAYVVAERRGAAFPVVFEWSGTGTARPAEIRNARIHRLAW